jgi:hypothetical protein
MIATLLSRWYNIHSVTLIANVVILSLLLQDVYAQPVTFTPNDTLLQRITGFANYADCVVDMNGDYLDDVVRIGSKGVFIDYQQEDGSFEGKQYNFIVESPPSWSICAGDIDNNGYNDLLLANSNSVSFCIANNSGNAYHEILMPGHIESQRSTMHDVNRDGWLDAFVCHESGQSVPYRNTGNGVMIPDSGLVPVSNLPGNYSAIWTDVDQDRDSDLYISKCWGGALPGDPIRDNLLYRNNGDNTFTEIAAAAGVNDNAQSWSTVFEDFDHDGDMDAFIVNHDMAIRLYRNNGNGTFTDVIASSGIAANDLGAFENSSGDFNNDGHIDIFAELTTPLYLGNGDLTFAGQDSPVTPGAIGDLNNDGFLDVVKANRVWLNDGNENHYVIIQTLGLVSNRSGIGATIEVYGAWGEQIREVRSGQSFSPMSSLNTYVGLGTHDHIDSILVHWPSGLLTRMSDLNTDTTYLIPEAVCVLPPVYLDVVSVIYKCEADIVSVHGPPGYMEYVWSNGDTTATIEIQQEGTYFALVTDSTGCTGVTNFFQVKTFIEKDPVILAPDGLIACEGNPISLMTDYVIPWTWSTGDTTTTIDINDTGWYAVYVTSTCDSTKVLSDSVFVNLIEADAPVPTAVEISAGNTVLLTATGQNIHWYDQDIGGNLLHIGNDFQTAELFNDTTFYLESHVAFGNEIQYGGKVDTIGAGGLPTQSGSLFFTAERAFTLETVDVYVPDGGPGGVRFVQLISNDSIITSKQFTVSEGVNVLDLNFDILPGEYELKTPQGNLFRNTGNVSFPYAIGTVGSITGSSQGDEFYYDFYNWRIRTDSGECISARVPLHVLITAVKDPNEIAIRISPNPASTKLFLTSPHPLPGTRIDIVDVNGHEVLSTIWQDNPTQVLQVESLSAGWYVVQLTDNDHVQCFAFLKL